MIYHLWYTYMFSVFTKASYTTYQVSALDLQEPDINTYTYPLLLAPIQPLFQNLFLCPVRACTVGDTPFR